MMETRFGRLVTGKRFPKIFLILYILFLCIAAVETNHAACFLFGREHLYGIVYFIFGVFVSMMRPVKKTEGIRHGTTYQKLLGFVMCFFIYYVFLLVTWSIICLLIHASETVDAAGTMIIAAFSAVVVLYGYLNTKTVKITAYTIGEGKTGRECRIALLSDIHLGVFVDTKHMKRVVEKLDALSADVVIIAGDIFDVDNALLTDSDKLAELSKVLKGIRSREGVYAVAGNHDPQVDNQIFRVFLENSHIRLLDNDVAELSCISLVGRTDASNNRREPLTELLNRCAGGKTVVIADHDPQGIREAVSHQADLVLCGHTHRGQFFPVTLFTKWANGKHYFYGHEVFGDTHAVISSGAGFFQLPVRIGTNNEIADICLKL